MRHALFRLLAIRQLVALATLLGAAAPTAFAAADPCQGTPNCRNLGAFTATAVKVNVTRQDRTTAYQTVRTTVRFTNVGQRPLALGWRDRSSAVSDDQGLAYGWSSKAYGIGVVGRGSADAQFQLAPGETREASFEGTVQYSLRRQVAGNVFSHDITIVELQPLGGGQLREAREHAINFSQLTASAGFQARAGQGMAPPGSPVSPDVPPAQGEAAPLANGADATCDPGSACQATGPLVARVLRVNVTQAGNVTAYQTVRTTVRFTNVGSAPLILGYKNGSGAVSDDTGQSYRWSSKAHGIGLVDARSADPQFRLAPGQSRDAAFESTLQYLSRQSRPGRVFTHEMTIAELRIVGAGQVRTQHEYALGFSNLSAGANLDAGAAGGPSANAAETVGKVVDLLKAIRK